MSFQKANKVGADWTAWICQLICSLGDPRFSHHVAIKFNDKLTSQKILSICEVHVLVNLSFIQNYAEQFETSHQTV